MSIDGMCLLVVLSPFDLRVRQVVGVLQDESQGLVSSSMVADALRLPARTTRYYLQNLEEQGALFRPMGVKSGYSAMPSVRPLAKQDDVRWKAQQLDPLDVQILKLLLGEEKLVSSKVMASTLDSPVRTVRYHLNQLEVLDLVARPSGSRSGYCAKGCGAIVAKAEAEQNTRKLSPFDIEIIELLYKNKHCSTGSTALSIYFEVKGRTMRYYLRKLENAGLLYRPDGAKSGYRVVRDVVEAILERIATRAA